MTEEHINKVIKSINDCLSISVDSCETCIHGDMSHPRCKTLLLMDAAEIIRYLREKKHDN